jgi:hypothetical protein
MYGAAPVMALKMGFELAVDGSQFSPRRSQPRWATSLAMSGTVSPIGVKVVRSSSTTSMGFRLEQPWYRYRRPSSSWNRFGSQNANVPGISSQTPPSGSEVR